MLLSSSLFSCRHVSEIMSSIESSLFKNYALSNQEWILTLPLAQLVNRWTGDLKSGAVRLVWNTLSSNPILAGFGQLSGSHVRCWLRAAVNRTRPSPSEILPSSFERGYLSSVEKWKLIGCKIMIIYELSNRLRLIFFGLEMTDKQAEKINISFLVLVNGSKEQGEKGPSNCNLRVCSKHL